MNKEVEKRKDGKRITCRLTKHVSYMKKNRLSILQEPVGQRGSSDVSYMKQYVAFMKYGLAEIRRSRQIILLHLTPERGTANA